VGIDDALGERRGRRVDHAAATQDLRTGFDGQLRARRSSRASACLGRTSGWMGIACPSAAGWASCAIIICTANLSWSTEPEVLDDD
jgi:hypothetical protein